MHVCEGAPAKFPWTIPLSDEHIGFMVVHLHDDPSNIILRKSPFSTTVSFNKDVFDLESSQLVLIKASLENSGTYILHTTEPIETDNEVNLVVHRMTG